MAIYGLIGGKLSHSFSKKYFSEKFQKLRLKSEYRLFELSNILEFEKLKKNPSLKGLNVTIPYKELIIPFLDEIDETANRIGAVNTIKIQNGFAKGFNTDYHGFKYSLENSIPSTNMKALVLGSGGASKAVQKVLDDMKIEYFVVSREKEKLTYSNLNKKIISNHKLIINTTPLGMYPNVGSYPDIPYDFLCEEHFCMDLVYNPEETIFMRKGAHKGAKVKNGLEMLYQQAEKSWEIWNT